MNIAVFNPQMGRFFSDVVEGWKLAGHEVRYDRYYNPENVLWADISWFFTCDNNIKSAINPDQAILADDSNFFPWALRDMDLTHKKIIVQPIDIEVWLGHHLEMDWSFVDDVVFIAPHIQALAEKDVDFRALGVNVHMIPLAVDTERYEFVDKPIGKKIAWVCEKWPTKGIDYALQIMAMLPKDYELHTIGGWNDRTSWEKAYQEDFIKKHDIKFFDYEWVEDQADWYKDKDFILSCSKKEAFGMSIAEGMSTGLIPVIHRFFGCDDLWKVNVWDTVDQAAQVIEWAHDHMPQHERRAYREYLFAQGYDLNSMLVQYDKVLKGAKRARTSV